MDQEVPTKDHNELKSVLIHALASNGNITDALSIYEEMKEAGCHVDPKTVITLIVSLYFNHMFYSKLAD